MPAERGYESQTMPSAAPMAPERDPREFGAGIGQAMQGLAGQVHEQDVRSFKVERQLEQDRQLAEWSKRFALHKQNMDGIGRDARATAQPGGMGHGHRIRETNEAARESLLDGIDDPTVRRLAEKQWTDYGTALYGQEGDWEEAQRTAKVVTDTGIANDTEINRIRRSDDPKAYASGLQAMLERNALLNVPPDVRMKLDQAAVQGAGTAFIQNLQDSNPQMAKAVLNSGEFDFLDPGTREQLLAGADVEIRRREAAAEHQANVAKAQQKEAIATLEQYDRDGMPVPDEQWDAAIKAARDMGDESGAVELEGMKANSRFARIYQGTSPVQREQALGKLKALKKPSVDQLREIKWLEDRRGSLDSRFDSDPVGWATQNAPAGSGPPPGDINDPTVARARVGWSRTMAGAYGRPDFPILSRAEAFQLGELRQSGMQGELRVLGWIDSLPDDRARRQAAREIAPGDKTFQAMALVTPRARETIRRGNEAFKANPRFLTPDRGTREGRDRADMMDRSDNDLRVAMKAFSPADVQAAVVIGRQFTAGVLSGSGKDVNWMNAGTYRMGQRVAVGGAVKHGRDVGGVAYWSNYPVLLPTELVLNPNQEVPGKVGSFGTAIANDMRQRKEYPVNPDGSTAAIQYLRPVLTGVVYDQRGTEVWLYRWEDRSGRPVQSNKGGDFVSRVENR